ncbi:PREDICTED: uncharacterized protein LOC105571179 [Vollenhovia emeryi]|uniref:uncharacterized protein LOC105571179 n=1 Tax=Vollenhovia emeryi TaxID=411798 RepID=UPI0005F4634B|nr:PREDICTED: uncharacterized protein LOC105571179 [Vollenhovia emeryi]
MADDLQALLVEQSTTIAAIKRVIPNFKKIGKANITIYKAKKRANDLESLWERCQRLNVRLLQAASAEDQLVVEYFADKEFLAAEDAYHEAADHLADCVGKFSRDRSDVAASSVSDSSLQDTSASSLQLPRISLPKFFGKFTEWENFRGIFESLVASQESLSNTQKLHYLKACVTGDAAVLINHIQIADTNYDAAWKLLVEEYDDQRAIIHAHIQAFAELPIMKTESAGELKNLRDTVAASLSALTNLERPVEKWDDLLVYIISQKFSPRTRNEWNLQRGKSNEFPTYEEIREFMTMRIRGLTDHAKVNPDASVNKIKTSNRASINNVTADKCLHCSGNHRLAQCDDFKRKSVEERTQICKLKRCCFNCLKIGHFPTNCSNTKRCTLCRRAHHTLLHRDSNATVPNTGKNSTAEKKMTISAPSSSLAAPESKPAVASVQTVSAPIKNPPTVLLATAWVILRTNEGRSFKVRALLDQGSAVSFVSETLCQTMRTKRYRANLRVHCFGERYSGVAKSRVSLILSSCNGQGPSFPLNAFIYQKITSYAVSRNKSIDSWPHLSNLSLADADPFSNHPIHLLIGADLYGSLLLHQIKQGPIGTPTAQLTSLGWILSGPTDASELSDGSVQSMNCVSEPSIEFLLRRFWEIEEVSSVPQMSDEDKRCEQHFVETHQRGPDGRYIVRLPFKTDPPIRIGASRETTALLYSKLEGRLQKNRDLARQYHEFLNDYVTKGHMELVSDSNPTRFPPVYIPHHPVLRESSSTTKLRVVFNASCKTSNGTTLNDHLMTGPKLQRELSTILLRWRQFRYVYTADIEKMFRQIRVNPDDVDFTRILWRSRDDRPIQSYRLLTVTYGTAPAPYLAMRVVNQLALDDGSSFPLARDIIQNSLYVDDVLFGADNIQSLRESRDQLTKLMTRGGFHLRKWAANLKELLEDIPPGEHELAIEHPFDKDNTLKVLGLTWIPNEDAFRFHIEPPSLGVNTKRSVLSFIARFFDPLGWASPVTITAKILIQELWIQKYD